MPQCRPRRQSPSESLVAASSGIVTRDEPAVERDERETPAYQTQKSLCLLCGQAFQSYDPRYNRRCPPCQIRVSNMSGLVDDDYHCRL
jgi:hypothetical protein